MWMIFLVTLAVIQCWTTAALDTFVLPEVKYADLVTLDDDAVKTAVSQLLEGGAVQISGIPRFGMARKRALEDLAECFEEETVEVSAQMADGSRRVSAAAGSERGVAGSMSHVCGEAASKLRAVVDAAASQLFLAFDAMASKRNNNSNKKDKDKEKVLLMEPGYASFRDLMSQGEHLEHLHTYFAPSSSSAAVSTSMNPATLDYHTDGGFMIAMTTGYYTNGAASDASGLYLEMKDGKRVKAEAQDDSLIILMGDGAARWLSPVLGRPFYAAKHALIADLPSGSQAARSWYGKMYLPPADAIIPQEAKTFGEYRHVQNQHLAKTKSIQDMSAQEALHKMLPSACGGDHYAIMTANSVGCASNEILCWANCMPVPTGCSAADAVCINTKDGTVSPGENHCMNPDGSVFCEPICPVVPVNSSDSGYCTGVGTSMYMSGFQSIAEKGEGEIQCVNLFFEEWTLDSRVKYAFACLGIFFMGILIQYLSKLRVAVSKWPESLGRKVAVVLIYGLHVMFGYFAMLAAMTYSVELFCMVVSGLTVGFAMFHLDTPNNVKSSDACCPDIDISVHDEKEQILNKDAKVISPENLAANYA